MKRLANILFCLPIFLISINPIHAAVVVYTDRVAWEAAALSLTGAYPTFSENFELYSPTSLSTGYNNFDPFSGTIFPDIGAGLTIDISGIPGLNSIDDSVTPDPFSNALSPNGSTYYLGETNGTALSLLFFPFAGGYNIPAFGADWVTLGDLTLETQGTTIAFADHLLTGSGFLGIVEDSGQSINGLTLNGTALFGMDELRYVATPVPSAVWLFGSGLLGLIGIVRRRKA